MTLKRSPGWQSSASQIAVSVENRMAFARSFLRTERLMTVMPTTFRQFGEGHTPPFEEDVEVAEHTMGSFGRHQIIPSTSSRSSTPTFHTEASTATPIPMMIGRNDTVKLRSI